MSEENNKKDDRALKEGVIDGILDGTKAATKATVDAAIKHSPELTSTLKTLNNYNAVKFGVLDAAISMPQYYNEEKATTGGSSERSATVAAAQTVGAGAAGFAGSKTGQAMGIVAGGTAGAILGGVAGFGVGGPAGIIPGAIEGAVLGARIGKTVGMVGGTVAAGAEYNHGENKDGKTASDNVGDFARSAHDDIVDGHTIKFGKNTSPQPTSQSSADQNTPNWFCRINRLKQ
jgi:hypothetical protein